MNYFIINDNISYAEKLKELLINIFKLNKDNFPSIYSVADKDRVSKLYRDLYDFKKKGTDICLIINSEISIPTKYRYETVGISLALDILFSFILDFKGKIILYGFLHEQALTKTIDNVKVKEHFQKSQNIFYLQLPASESAWQEKLIEYNNNTP